MDCQLIQGFKSKLLAITPPIKADPAYAFTHLLVYLLPILLLLSRSVADLSLLLVDGLFLIKSYREKNWAWLNEKWFKLSLLFWAYLLLVNVPLSINPTASLMHGLIFIRWPLFAAALAYWLLASFKLKRAMMTTLIIVIIFIMLDTWLQYSAGLELFHHAKFAEDRLTGPFTKPIVGIMLVRLLFLGLLAGLVFNIAKSPTRYWVFSCLLLSSGLFTIFISGERMALILCLSGICVIVIGFWLQYTTMRKPISIFVTLLLVTLSALVCLMPVMAERNVYNLLSKLTHFSSSDYGVVFQAAWLTWKEHLLFGSGYHTYKTSCEVLGVLVNTPFHCSHPHNLYLHIGTETGIVGLMFFLYMALHIYISALKPHYLNKHWLTSALAFTILSLSFWPLIGGISLLNNAVAPLMWLGVGWALAIAPSKKALQSYIH